MMTSGADDDAPVLVRHHQTQRGKEWRVEQHGEPLFLLLLLLLGNLRLHSLLSWKMLNADLRFKFEEPLYKKEKKEKK